MRRLPGDAERLQASVPAPAGMATGTVIAALPFPVTLHAARRRARSDGLRRLADRLVAITLFVSVSIAASLVLVLQPDIDPRAVPRRPDAMRQLADRNRRDLGKSSVRYTCTSLSPPTVT